MAEPLITEITIPYPDAAGYHLVLKLNGIQLKTTSTFSEDWVAGRSTYKRPPEPEFQVVGGEATISQEYIRSELTNLFRVAGDSPLMELQLSQKHSFRLTADTLGDATSFDLGALPLTELSIAQKLGPCNLDFSAPNPQVMRHFYLEAYATHVEAHNLFNANFEEMVISGSSGTHQLYFNGTLRRDAVVKLQAKESPTTLHIPAQYAVRIESIKGELDTADIEFEADDAFIKHESGYCTQAALSDQAPLMTVKVDPLGPLSVKAL